MTDKNAYYEDLVRRALVRVDEAETALRRERQAHHEPIAVVGMACRLPGKVNSPKDYWQLLQEQADAITEVPADRWNPDEFWSADPETSGGLYTRWGGFLEKVDCFDAVAFGISPREAASMDPQQRLMLEVAWQGLEAANIAPMSLSGSATGVVVGVGSQDYFRLATATPQDIGMHTGTGTSTSVIAGRLAYTLGLEGPAMVVNTACSSSLMAVHLACQQLRNRESNLALAGGVSLMLTPVLPLIESRTRLLSPGGRCRPFDASADGVVRGEGCAIVVLERLSDALAAGHPIRSVIIGSSANQDGRSGGLTVPSALAQEAVLRKSLEQAQVAPHHVRYVEAHGTGTSLGDPIEIEALGGVLGHGRPKEDPLLVGSVKSNIGHLEAAAGIAGLLKVVLSLEAQTIPAQLYCQERNPRVDWDAAGVDVVTAPTPFEPIAGRRIAGVSSFGFSGTNVHVLLEEAPVNFSEFTEPARTAQVLTLSAHTKAALDSQITNYIELLDTSPVIADVCATSNLGRSHLPHRIAVVGADLSAIRSGLASGVNDDATFFHGHVRKPARVAFLFPGNGSQELAMGLSLLDSEPAYKQAFDRCATLIGNRYGRPMHMLIADSDWLSKPSGAQVANVVMGYALSEWWRTLGVIPNSVLGHSGGELTAACVAGVLSLEDTMRFAIERGALLDRVAEHGGMAAVRAEPALLAEVLKISDCVVAAYNGPDNVVLAGPQPALSEQLVRLQERGASVRILDGTRAFHSPAVRPILGDLELLVRSLDLRRAQCGFVSTVTGASEVDALTEPSYWVRHTEQAVQFQTAIQTLQSRGCDVFIELGVGATLAALGRESLPADDLTWLAGLRPGRPEEEELVSALAAAHVAGVAIDWQAFHRDRPRKSVTLPTYPFEGQRHWIAEDSRVFPSVTPGLRESLRGGADLSRRKPGAHPLLGSLQQSILTGKGQRLFEATVGLNQPAFLSDHRVGTQGIFPAAGYIEMAFAAASFTGKEAGLALSELVLGNAMLLQPDEPRRLQTLTEAQDSGFTFQIYSAATNQDEPSWLLHASGRISIAQPCPQQPIDLEEILNNAESEIDPEEHYAKAARWGLSFGPAFRGVQTLWKVPEGGLAQICLPASQRSDVHHYRLHPVLLDACLQSVSAVFGEPTGAVLLPSRVDSIHLWGPVPEELYCRTQYREEGTGMIVDGTIFGADGTTYVEIRGLHLQPAPSLASETASTQVGLYTWRWDPAKPCQSPAFPLPSAQTLASYVQERRSDLVSVGELTLYADRLPPLETRAIQTIERSLASLGWSPEIGSIVVADALREQLGIVKRYERLLVRLLARLVSVGLLRPVEKPEEGWEVLRSIAPPVQESVEDAIERFPEIKAELQILDACGQELPSILRGTCDPLTILFPNGESDVVAQLYRNAPVVRLANQLLATAMQAIVESLPAGRPLRVLEIGAGTGETTSHLLPLLPVGSEYIFSDVSPVFGSRVRERFAQWGFVDYQVLDLNESPDSQGFVGAVSGDFDVVVASNVLHVTQSVKRSLAHVHSLLAPGGMLLMMESGVSLGWVELSFGLTQGWWASTDLELRPNGPLLAPNAWCEALGQAGFEKAEILAPGSGVASHQVVIAAQRSITVADTQPLAIVTDSDDMATGLAACLDARACPSFRCDADEVSGRLAAGELAGVVYLPAPADELRTGISTSCRTALQLVQALMARPREMAPPPLWFVTSGAAFAMAGDRVDGLAHRPIWSIAQVAMREDPALRCLVVDIDYPSAESGLDLLASEILSRRPQDLPIERVEERVAHRSGTRLVSRLVPWRPDTKTQATGPLAQTQVEFDPEAVYLITGGLGGLGLVTAAWMVKRGARHVQLFGRSGPTPAAAEQIAALESLGATITTHQVDVCDEHALSEALGTIRTQGRPLRGVVHSVGVLRDGLLENERWASFEQVMAPKVYGGWLLHKLTLDDPLDLFVLYSSAVALLGAWGQANHTAANTFLDGLAHYRRAQGRPALTVDWGAIDGIGAARSSDAEQKMQSLGMTLISVADGLCALETLVSANATQVGVVSIDWARFAQRFSLTPLYSELYVATAVVPKADSSLLAALEQGSVKQRRGRLEDHVQTVVQRVMGSTRSIERDARLHDLGFDSLMSVELKNQLSKTLGTSLRSSLVFDFPTIIALVEHLGNSVLKLWTADAKLASDAVSAYVDDGLGQLSDDQLFDLLDTEIGNWQEKRDDS